MFKLHVILYFLGLSILSINAQQKPNLSEDLAYKLAKMPMGCISQEYPNKTAHTINNVEEARMSPKELHPSFFGCFDWHSSVHGHWSLVRLLKIKPNLSNVKDIEKILDESFNKENIKKEAEYFSKYKLANLFERTYGWAWLLKLDEELITWDSPLAKKWHQNLQPLTEVILKNWKIYLPKQTYPNRTGVHANSAFALAFALDWSRAVKNKEFENLLVEKAKYFYLKDTKTPAYLEPNGSDFFSPSLQIADLMRRILPKKDFEIWFNAFYEARSIKNLKEMPIVSDLSDYQTVHLVGLSFTRAWCMKGISEALPSKHKYKKEFATYYDKYVSNGLDLLFKSNYGGDHWLASFALYSLE